MTTINKQINFIEIERGNKNIFIDALVDFDIINGYPEFNNFEILSCDIVQSGNKIEVTKKHFNKIQHILFDDVESSIDLNEVYNELEV